MGPLSVVRRCTIVYEDVYRGVQNLQEQPPHVVQKYPARVSAYIITRTRRYQTLVTEAYVSAKMLVLTSGSLTLFNESLTMILTYF